MWGRYPDMIILNSTEAEPLTGTFYIGVLGSSDSVYSLNYHTVKTSKEIDGDVTFKDPILLQQDKPTKGVLINGQDYGIYRISIGGIARSENLNIDLSSENGEFEYYVRIGDIPTEKDFDFVVGEAEDYEITLPGDKLIGNVFIKVSPIGNSNGVSLTFYISYSVGTHSQNLLDGTPARDVVKQGFYSYFNYVYTPINQDIVIKLTTLSGDPDIFISLKSELKFPTKAKSDIISTSTRDSDQITISASQLPSKCLDLTFDQSLCSIHIGVFSDERFDSSSFSIVVSRAVDKAITQLLDGVP